MSLYLTTLLLAFGVILAVVAAMAIGIIYGRPAIRGSCGGLAGGSCELCSGRCDRRSQE